MSKTFDEKANHWDLDPIKVKRAEAIALGIRSSITIKPGMTALEYGCGTGLLSFELHQYLAHITLADNSEGMLEELRNKIKKSTINNMAPLKLDLLTDPMPIARYSLIYSLMTLHHIIDLKAIIEYFYLLLLDNGVLCIADLDKEDGSFHGKDFDGHNGFDRIELEKLVKNVGFKEVAFKDIFQMPRDVNGTTKMFPMFLMTAWK